MAQQVRKQQAAAPLTIEQVRELAESLTNAMSSLLSVIEKETELVRAGKLREAMALEPQKSEMSRGYVNAVTLLKTNHEQLEQSSPELLTTLHRHHDTFRAMLQINLTVLATAHAVSESIVRGVNSEMQRSNIPSTYTAAGRRAAPGPRHIAPIALSRSL